VVAELVEASKRPQVFYELIKMDGKEQCQKAQWWFRQAQPPQVSDTMFGTFPWLFVNLFDYK